MNLSIRAQNKTAYRKELRFLFYTHSRDFLQAVTVMNYSRQHNIQKLPFY